MHIYSQLDPASAVALVDFALKQLGPGITLVILLTAGFCWFFRGYAAGHAAQLREAQRLYHSQLEQLSCRFGSQLAGIMSQQEAFQIQLHENARENAEVWRKTLASMAAMERSVGTLTLAVQHVLDGRDGGSAFPPVDLGIGSEA